MGDIEEARNQLNRIIQGVRNYAPSFYAQIEQIEVTKKELKKLQNEQQSLEDRISQEEKISSAYRNLLNLQERRKNEYLRRYEESVNIFRSEALKNAIYAISAGKKPLIYKFRGVGSSPLIQNFLHKSQIIKKKAEITRKVHHLRQLQHKIFCISEDFDNGFEDIFFKYQINQNDDYSDYKLENFSSPIKSKLMEQEIPDPGYITKDSISNLSNFFSNTKPFLSNNSNENNTISLSTFSFPKSRSIAKKDFSYYFLEFNKLISPTLEETINNIDNLLKEINEILQVEESTIQIATERFFRCNPSYINTASVLRSNIIFKVQEKIHVAEQILFVLNQNIFPESKVLNESHRIQILLDELVSIFDAIYDRLSRNQIICQNISFDFNQSDSQYFTIDELSRTQIERCNSIVKEMKKIFEQSLTINNSFLGIVDDILTRSRENQQSRPKLEKNIKVPPPIKKDYSKMKEKFLQLQQRILNKQSEQLDSFCKSLEELSPKIKEIQIKETIENQEQPNISPGLHFPSIRPTNQQNISEKSFLEFQHYLDQIKSNPYQNSNQNLLGKVIQKIKEPAENKIMTSKKLAHSENGNNNDNDSSNSEISNGTKKYYEVIENMTNDLSSSICTDNIEDLIRQRNNLIEELRQKTERFKYSQTKKNEEIKIRISQRELIKSKKEERETLKQQFKESKSLLQSATNNLNEMQEEIQQLESKKNELESQQFRIQLLKSKYDECEKKMNDLNEEERKFDEMQDEQK